MLHPARSAVQDPLGGYRLDIRESIDRIFSQKTRLTDRFYEVFLDRYPEVKPYFEGADLEAQSVMLTMALGAVREHPEIKNAFREYLRVLGTKHKRKGIPKELYPKFLEALLATLEEFHGDDWDENLARQWTDAVQDASELMFEGYGERFHI